MLSISGITNSSARDYYKKEYYSKEEKGKWVGNLKDELNIKSEFSHEKFKSLLQENERFRAYNLNLTLSKSLSEQFTDINEYEEILQSILPKIKEEIETNLNIKLKNDINLYKNPKGQIACQLTSHNIAKGNWDKIKANLSNSKAESFIQKEMVKGFKKSGFQSEKKDFSFKTVESSGKVGIDLTFSVPKSVSLTMMTSDNHFNNICKAQNDAVSKTLSFIERDLISSRVQIDNMNFKEKTGNMIASTFNHFTNRNQDPQFHTHTVIFNSTLCSDRKLRTIDSVDLFRNQNLIGKIHANYLMDNLKQMDYPLEITDKDYGNFEISGFTREQLQKYSSRSKEKNEYLAEYLSEKNRDLSSATAKEKQIAVLNTRSKKEELPLTENISIWRDQFRADNIYEPKMQTNPKIETEELNEIFKKSKRNIENRKVVFTKIDFMNESLTTGCSILTLDQIESQFDNNPDFIRLGTYRNELHFSTQRSIDIERSIYEFIQSGKNSCSGINSLVLNNHLVKTDLTTGRFSQKEALFFITSSNHRILAIQGDAGTGKTYMLNEAKNMFDQQGIKSIALAPSNIAVSELKDKANFESSYTIHSFLNKLEKEAGNKSILQGDEIQNDWNLHGLKTSEKKEIWVIDEASMIDNNTLKTILEASERRNSKIVLIGDSKQLQPVGAGNSYSNLIHKNQIPYTEMKINLRQYNSPKEIKRAVDFAAQGEIIRSVKELEKRILTIMDEDKRLFQIAKDFCDLNKIERDRATIITCTNRDRVLINSNVREILKSNNQLGDEFEFEIKDIRGKNHLREFSSGDKIIFLKTDKLYENKVVNNQIGEIKKIEGHWIYVKSNGNTIKFSVENYNNFEHAYAKTTYKEQAKTYDKVFINIDTNQKNMNSKNDYYVKISRAKSDLKIYTNDKYELLEEVAKEQKKLSFEDFGFNINNNSDITYIKNPDLSNGNHANREYLNDINHNFDKYDNILNSTVISESKYKNLLKEDNLKEFDNEKSLPEIELEKVLEFNFVP